MNRPASLSPSMLVKGRRPPTRPMALAPGQQAKSPNAEKIEAMLIEARREMGYDREGFIRVERPQDTAPGTLMGKFRVVVPRIEP